MVVSSRISLLIDDKNSNLPQISNKRNTTENSQSKWQARSNKSLGNELKILNMADNIKTPLVVQKNENYKSMDRRPNHNRSQSQKSYISEKSQMSLIKENKTGEPNPLELQSEKPSVFKGESNVKPQTRELSPVKAPIQHKL